MRSTKQITVPGGKEKYRHADEQKRGNLEYFISTISFKRYPYILERIFDIISDGSTVIALFI